MLSVEMPFQKITALPKFSLDVGMYYQLNIRIIIIIILNFIEHRYTIAFVKRF